MNDISPELLQKTDRRMKWTGRVVSALVVAAFVMSGVMKLKGGPELEEGMAHLGIPLSLVRPLAILELTCAAIYALPATAVLGAVLLTGYMGGAICTHWRVGDPFLIQMFIGLLVWLGVYLREHRVRALLPIRFTRHLS